MIGYCKLLEKQENVVRTVGVNHLPKLRRPKQNTKRMIAPHALSIHEKNKRRVARAPMKKKREQQCILL